LSGSLLVCIIVKLFLGKTSMMLPLLALIAAETVGELNSFAPAEVNVSQTLTPLSKDELTVRT
jgi:hypothetical protein